MRDILRIKKISFSLEFFPPKSKKERDKLFLVISDLLSIKPSYVTVTYGAGGSTREGTYELVVRIQKEMRLPTVAHLTSIGSSEGEIRKLLERYARKDVRNILALRGDPPKGHVGTTGRGDFPYAADLVSYIKKHFPDMGGRRRGFP